MKGIILAGGKGTRLYPMTRAVSKQLLPIYDKPMIYYPLSVLMLAGIREVLIISTPEDTPVYKELLGDGKTLGMRFEYKVQQAPKGLAEAFILGEEFIGDDAAAMVLGDNIFVGRGLESKLHSAVKRAENGEGATVFGYQVPDPKRFGIMGFNKEGKVTSLAEKPKRPRSNWCVTGLYFYDRKVVDYVKTIQPSARGELEITDLNRIYLSHGALHCELLGRGYHWLDTGTHESLAEATAFVRGMEKRHDAKIGCLEEIAYRNGWITRETLIAAAEEMGSSTYGEYLKRVAGITTNKKK